LYNANKTPHVQIRNPL